MRDVGKRLLRAGVRTFRWEEASLLLAVPLVLLAAVIAGVAAVLPLLSSGPAARTVAVAAIPAPEVADLLPDATPEPMPPDTPPLITRTDALPETWQVLAASAAPSVAIPATPAVATPASSAGTPATTPTLRITAVGDSVMLGAATELTQQLPNTVVDAAVSRQVFTVVDILKRMRDTNKLGDVVILHIGNNGDFSAAQFDEVMATLGVTRRVIFLTLKEPRAWEEPNNAVIAAGVARYPNTALVDWRGMSMEHAEYFGADEIHLTPAGAQAYAALVRAHLFPVKAEARS